MRAFKINSDLRPQGDQPEAIQQLVDGLNRGDKFQTLLGVTGSGKTFTMANVIQAVQKPTLIMSHNKTLAAQLFGEFKSFFPENAVEFFISYYDYYQPEAYIPSSDTYIEKDTQINEEIDRLRLRATSSLLERRDVIIVASVSSIYGLGSPKDYKDLLLFLETGKDYERRTVLSHLVEMQYTRNDVEFPRGTFRVKGDVIEIHPAYEETAFRLDFFGDTLESITHFKILTGDKLDTRDSLAIYPAKHFVTSSPNLTRAMKSIQEELEERIQELRGMNKLIEAQRIEQRTRYDLEMLREVGFCSGVENYSRHISGRKPGERPDTLFDYFPKDFLLIVDESHVTIPQIGGMYRGDRARKVNLVEFGFRLPSAFDNRPMYFEEWEAVIDQCVFVSATPGDYEVAQSKGVLVEQIIRPTGLLDPEIAVRPSKGQIDDLLGEIRETVARGERVLVLTLTKRMSEHLAEYLEQMSLRVKYLHSEIDSLERVEILRDLRLKRFDVLVGINLLREGLDLPEVSLVAILDADKEGFLRSERSLLQIAGRAARNINGRVIFYADKVTDSMRKVMDETERRRTLQREYNSANGITPASIVKSIEDVLISTTVADAKIREIVNDAQNDFLSTFDLEDLIVRLEKEMKRFAKEQNYEKAAELRDEITKLKEQVRG
ncbi:MAG: excinuclease ABC subunit UvrB [Calditrichaeota bacterium]|nr:excinuclease ABC subunit UvrB [Calditrichota bacterium]MCB9366551.1 excinuclease ABC subunit UvrB [Calditrichota bacterium]MCB9391191.1 excinuclease ABC subunit UvrB [Calditrichota bacterium]